MEVPDTPMVSAREQKLRAVEQAVQQYSTDIYRVAYVLTKNAYDAADVMQEVFLKLLRREKAFASPEHERAWLIRAAVGRCHRLCSAPWRRKVVLREEMPELLEPSSFQDKRDESVDLFNAVASLSYYQRLCIHLFYYEDLSVTQIGDITGLKEGTVRSHLSRGRSVLRRLLSEDMMPTENKKEES